MDARIEQTRSPQKTGTPALAQRLRRYFSGRRALAMLALAVIAAGIALSWSWLVAVGVAPLLLALAPCAAMCALGLCMSRNSDKPSSAQRPGPAHIGTNDSASAELQR